MVSSVKPEDQFSHWKGELESDILVSLASLAGERMFFEGDNSSGVSGDLEHATNTATNMEAVWGMGQNVAVILAPRGPGAQVPPTGRGDEPPANRRHIAERVEDNLKNLLQRAADILETNRREVLSLAHALEANKTLSGDDVIAVIEKHQGPIIDGRPYANDAFYREIEAYHRAALIAHINHTSIKLTLPVAPVIEEDAWSGPRQPHGLLLPQPPGAVPGASVPGTPNGGTTPGQPTYGQPGYGQPPAYGQQQPPAFGPPPAYGPPAAPPAYGPPPAPPAGGPPPGADGTAPGGAAAPFTDPS
jgi:hypothetical protein